MSLLFNRNLILKSLFICVFSLFFSSPLLSSLYEEDNRQLLSFEKALELNKKGLYPVALIKTSQKPDESLIIKDYSLEDRWNLCPDRLFGQVLAPAYCSGFFIASDLILTAQHCLKSDPGLLQTQFVLNYWPEQKNSLQKIDSQFLFEKDQVIYENEFLDVAIIRVHKKIPNFTPPKLYSAFPTPEQSDLSVLGHPLGIGLTLADQGKVLSYSPELHRFYTTLDAFSINSGSVVFDTKTSEIVGFLSAGRWDLGPKIKIGQPVCNDYRTVPTPQVGEQQGERVVDIKSIFKAFFLPSLLPFLQSTTQETPTD